jgi:hypothetical protein
MNSKRKADLQRKLSMASVPKPPAGLSDRIKRDIPEYLGTQPERERFTKSVAFNLRVAASILLLVSSVYLCMQILNRTPTTFNAQKDAPSMASAKASADNAADIPANIAPPEARERVIAPNVPPATPQRIANVIAPSAAVAERIALHREVDAEKKENQNRDADAAGVVATFSAPAAVSEPVIVVQAQAPAIAPAAAPPPPPPAPVAVAEAEGRTDMARAGGAPVSASIAPMAKTSQRSEIVRSAQAADLNLAARKDVFGFSVNPTAFEQVKSAIERGEHPSNVDVEALINYFAGSAKRAPREVSLDVEGSPAPVSNGDRTVLVRYTVDTARADIAPHGSIPPIATDASVEIEFDPRAVASYRLIGGGRETNVAEATLLKNTSVTAVYAVKLQENVNARTPLATVTLRYKSVSGARVKPWTRTLRVGDVTRAWATATRRHRLASLGAVWGETLKSSTSGTDVARRAEELSKQEPADERARELATLANASGGLR